MITVKEILSTIKVIAIGLAFVVGVSFASAAWVGPTEAPPAGNTPAPVNVGSEFQEKTGDFWANSVGVDVGYCIGSDCITEWWPDSLGGGGGSSAIASGTGVGVRRISGGKNNYAWETIRRVPIYITEDITNVKGQMEFSSGWVFPTTVRFKIGGNISNESRKVRSGEGSIMSGELTLGVPGPGWQTLEIQGKGFSQIDSFSIYPNN